MIFLEPKFKAGDNVLIISTSAIGTVNQVIIRESSIGYKVTVNGKLATYNEKYLEAYAVAESEECDSVVCGNAGEFKFFITGYKMKKPIEGNIYSYLASKTVFNPFQFKPLMKFISPGSENRLFIADEVGVGKTIETGIIIAELIARGVIRKKSPIMIVCPNSLGPKWVKEMNNRFNLDFHLHDGQTLEYTLKSMKNGIVPERYCWGVAGLQLMRFPKYREILNDIEMHRIDSTWKLIVVDESHHMRNPNTESNELGKQLGGMTEMMLMLSATPLNLRDEDFYNQMHILNPEIFPDYITFKAFISPVKSLNRIRKLLIANDAKSNKMILEEMNNLTTQSMGDIFLSNPIIKDLKDKLLNVHIFTTSELIKYEQLLISLSPLDTSFTRTLKREAIPHRVIREPLKIGVKLSENELDFYNEVIRATRENYLQNGGNASAIGFITNMPQRMASSCIPAMKDYLKWSLDNRKTFDLGNETIEDIEDDSEINTTDINDNQYEKYSSLLKKAEEIEKNDSKYASLVELLNKLFNTLENKQVIIFSFFVRTLKYLESRLAKDGYSVGIIYGDMPVQGKGNEIGRYSVIQEFQDKKFQILLSSEVGGEGLDFQFCQAIINYDLPYNPMRIEQRIGRIDRFGQMSDKVIVASMFIKDTLDEEIYNALYERIKIVEEGVGFVEPIIDDNITELQNALIRGMLSESQKEQRLKEIEYAIEQAKLETERFESGRTELLGDDYFSKTITNIDDSQFISPSDALEFTKMCLSEWEDCDIDIENEEKCTIHLSNFYINKLRSYLRKPGNEGAFNELDPIVKNGKRIKVIFNGSSSLSNPNYHFLSPCGFWIKFLLKETESKFKEYNLFTGNIPTSIAGIEKGRYIVCIFEIKLEGFKTEYNLAAVPYNLETEEVVNCDYLNFIKCIVSGIKPMQEETQDLDFIEFSSVKDKTTEMLEEYYSKFIEMLEEENRYRVETRIKSMRIGSNNRIDKLKSKMNSHIENSSISGSNVSTEFIRLIESQIKNEESFIEDKIVHIDKLKNLTMCSSHIKSLYLNVLEE